MRVSSRHYNSLLSVSLCVRVSSRHYEFVLQLANTTLSDLHRYDLQVANELGTTVGSVHLALGQCTMQTQQLLISLQSTRHPSTCAHIPSDIIINTSS